MLSDAVHRVEAKYEVRLEVNRRRLALSGFD